MNSKYVKADSGFKFPYGNQRLSIAEISEIAECSYSITHKALRDFNEDPEKFVERIKRKRLLKGKN